MSTEDPVHIRLEGVAGVIRLDRPQTLNAISHEVVASILGALTRWQTDPAVKLVLIEAAPGKAFCAGGDLKELYQFGLAGDVEAPRQFWRAEYQMNALIAHYPKPVVALVDGLVMGGGVGLFAHARHRVVTENTAVAMPECAVGLIPDVGAMAILAKMPGHLGEYMALTGMRLPPADAVATGFADARVASSALPDLRAILTCSGDPDRIRSFATDSGPETLSEMRGRIDGIFGLGSVEAICIALETRNDNWAKATQKQIKAGSPISLKATLAAVRMARAQPGVDAALVRDFRFVSRCFEEGDFLEGIRATVIDKDKSPRWRFQTLPEVPQQYIDGLFAPAPGGDLELQIAMEDGR